MDQDAAARAITFLDGERNLALQGVIRQPLKAKWAAVAAAIPGVHHSEASPDDHVCGA